MYILLLMRYHLETTLMGGLFWEVSLHIRVILPKGPYLPCISMAGRAFLAGYHRYVLSTFMSILISNIYFLVNKPYQITHNLKIIFSLQLNRMQTMCKDLRLGLIHVLSENFCQSCIPFPSSVMKAVVSKLPVIALKRNEDLLTIIKVRFLEMQFGLQDNMAQYNKTLHSALL